MFDPLVASLNTSSGGTICVNPRGFFSFRVSATLSRSNRRAPAIRGPELNSSFALRSEVGMCQETSSGMTGPYGKRLHSL